MTELLVEFRKCFVRIVLLYIALPAAVVCGAALALWRIVDAFVNEIFEFALHTLSIANSLWTDVDLTRAIARMPARLWPFDPESPPSPKSMNCSAATCFARTVSSTRRF